MTDRSSQYAGAVREDSPAAPLGKELTDGLQEWLFDLLSFGASEDVRPGWLGATAKAPDWGSFVSFSYADFERQPATYIDQTDEGRTFEYHATFSLRVLLRGEGAHAAALFLCDALEIGQNTEILDALGLGLTDAAPEILTQATSGQTLIETATVVLSFNYTYSRTWAVRSLASASAGFRINR